MKKNICLFLLFVFILGATAAACRGETESPVDIVLPPETAEVYIAKEPTPTPVTATPEPTPDIYEKLPGKIAIIPDGYEYRNGYGQVFFSIKEIVAKYGRENTVIVTLPDYYYRDMEEKLASMINSIAKNPEIKVLIISPANPGTDYIVSILRELRDDIFIVYTEHTTYDEADYPLLRNTVPEAAAKANLILNFNHIEASNKYPVQAKKLGAKTLAYFYGDYSDFYYDYNEYENYKKTVTSERNMLRAICRENNLKLVEVDGLEQVQCGSSANQYLSDTIPPLIDKYGKDIVFAFFEEWRLFGYCTSLGAIYLSSFEDPLTIAGWLGVDTTINHNEEEIADVVEDIKKALEEQGMLGRVASSPVSIPKMFTHAAADYGVKWMKGEVPQEGIDVEVLEQCMAEYIFEYSGTEIGVICTPLVENGVTYENYLLVIPDDYLIY